jgi:predicted ATP-dependent serine protease
LLKLSRAWGTVTTKATPLPEVWKELTLQDIRFRRGQVCMIAAAPNAGKSMLALVYSIKAGIPTLFFSADTDTATVMLRTAAAVSGHTQLTVEQNLERDSSYYDEAMAKADHIQWVFDSSPSLDDIEMEVKAYLELYGEMPQLIVIDNLMNVVSETDNEWAGLRAIMAELHDMARKTEACVMVLHHVSEASEYGSPEMPPPRRAIHGKVSQLPAMICTLGYDPANRTLRVAAVKNRFGKHTANGNEWATFSVNFASCQIESVTSEAGKMFYRDAQYANRQQ